MAVLTERRKTAKPVEQRMAEKQGEDKSKNKLKAKLSEGPGPNLEPNIRVVGSMAFVFIALIVAIFYYKVDNRENGPFATWVNLNYPIVERTLNRPKVTPIPMFGAQAQETTGQIKLTEEELKEFDGTDADKPIYLGINGTIFDVSASPAFYGPGGHYNHFVGKDATRAWITECWDTPDQFTWRLDGIEVMFMNKYLDEQLQSAAEGDVSGLGDIGAMPNEMIGDMAKKAMERFGKVTEKDKEKRRTQDKIEAEAKVQETLAHWVKFFSGNAKYKVVGSVILEDKPEPPAPCEAAMKKRPLKGGKLESLMGAMGPMVGGGGAGAGAGKDNNAGEMPAAVKEQIAKAKKAKEEAAAAEKADKADEDDEDLVHEEL
ncbi:hypothetical protein DOTSEDRAFT_74781 [Dothistroma septosporum NZE10]|uniref:Cytochrome b5 heme-binding domain-containing protein n=1 Tax=Dothistroma septosporum (strain NZE10 / CBS 128990) TaxID=675120 RepID=N1PD58_DOTSN|nr:hypothetical protein DOTSEDRAFT_74781 [Dothistroma septosporum NZE10]